MQIFRYDIDLIPKLNLNVQQVALSTVQKPQFSIINSSILRRDQLSEFVDRSVVSSSVFVVSMVSFGSSVVVSSISTGSPITMVPLSFTTIGTLMGLTGRLWSSYL